MVYNIEMLISIEMVKTAVGIHNNCRYANHITSKWMDTGNRGVSNSIIHGEILTAIYIVCPVLRYKTKIM